ncbi:hypothetical protein [Jeotgalibacillus campisalis]|uniref:DUF2953 domain-containing protein n=1 Tax=Jeotgalibacillus campisalis TaxID=220754 RepID=A0A0C2RX50_9BACL|nr:hypothetical protein [Jeotgalibacillus campisalis]KIL46329.1 hypothetical protein KR50_30040 [Jeotgalibacillus campisalis]
MWIFAGISFIILILLIYLFYSKITMTIRINFQKGLKHADIQFKVFNGVYKKKFSIPLFEQKGEGIVYAEQTNLEEEKETEKLFTIQDMNQAKELYDRFLQQYNHVKRHTKELVKKVKIEKLSTDVKIGLEEADWTAYLTSGVWMFHSWITLLLSSVFQLKCKPEHHVHSLFGVNAFALHLSCIASIRLGHLIVIGIRFRMDQRVPKT